MGRGREPAGGDPAGQRPARLPEGESPLYRRSAELAKWLAGWFHTHLFAFFTGLVLLLAVDWLWLEGWALFWPTGIWAVLFGLHYLVYKALTVDDEWAEDRVVFEVYKPWDMGHIDDIRRNPYGRSPHRTEEGDGPAETGPAAMPPDRGGRRDHRRGRGA